MLHARFAFPLIMLFAVASCNKAENRSSLDGKYKETFPAPGRCYLAFTHDGKLIRTERGSRVADVFTYTLTDSSIIMKPTWNANHKPAALYFRRLSIRSFEIGYLYPVNTGSQTPTPPPMIFERE